MVDTRTPDVRRRSMQSEGTKDTGPELTVRRALFERGYRYRLHRKDLPGSPDIVFPSRKKAVFVHGCFWHGHGCQKGRAPKSRTEYWGPKIEANRLRDERNIRQLTDMGWDTLVIWQCDLADLEKTLQHIIFFLENPKNAIDSGSEAS